METTNEELSLKEIQNASLNILKYIHELCDRYGISYWLIYGTLLGAVRHKGFIPWDDDIDIAMRRDDYEKFMAILNEETNKEGCPFYYDHFTVSKDYPYYILRICDSRYRVEFKSSKHVSGLFVDVYPFDDTGDDVNYWNNRLSHTELIKKCMLLSTNKSMLYGNSISHKLLNLPLVIYSKLFGTSFFMRRIDNSSRVFNGRNSGFVGLTSWADMPRIFPEEYFKELTQIKFENYMFYVPSRYDEVLTQIYGDYMKLPEEKDRVAHHNYKAYRK